MQNFWVRLAGQALWLATAYAQTASLFAAYSIVPTDADRADWVELAGRNQPLAVSQPDLLREQGDEAGQYPPAYLESLALYRQICHLLLRRDILLFHCSALAIGGRAVLFTAPSGTGKSTHAALWRQRFGAAVVTVNDDKPLIAFAPDAVTVYGTPYGGKDNLQTNTSAPVAAILILHQAPQNAIVRVTARAAYPLLLNQCYRRQDAAGLIHTMDLAARLAALPVYCLGCNISQQAVTTAYEQLKGDGVL